MARPSTPLLSRDLIVDAALAIVDADGVGGLTTRRLASELGVSGPSLYHHFRNKDEILDAIGSRIYGQITLSEAEVAWDAALTDYAYQLRSLLVRHPHVVELLAMRQVREHVGLRIYENLIGRLVANGWSVVAARDAILAVENLVYGAALMANAPEIELSEGQRQRYPTLTALSVEGSDGLSVDGFELGFAALLEGLLGARLTLG
jgi:AcrR family transcriptional regulator